MDAIGRGDRCRDRYWSRNRQHRRLARDRRGRRHGDDVRLLETRRGLRAPGASNAAQLALPSKVLETLIDVARDYGWALRRSRCKAIFAPWSAYQNGMMQSPLTKEDQELDRQWRATFGEPMPILGGGDIVRQILAEAKQRQLSAAGKLPTPVKTVKPR